MPPKIETVAEIALSLTKKIDVAISYVDFYCCCIPVPIKLHE
jgi:hypothetical protein